MGQPLNAKVIGRIEFAPGVFSLQVTPVGWPLPEFKAGQYCVLGLPGSAPRSLFSDAENPPADPEKMIRRAYSASSASTTKEYAEFYVSLVRSGALTPRLHALAIGDMLWMGPKFTGLMTLENVPKDANVILIATGTGLAPYMSMIRTLATAAGFDRTYAVIHGANHSWDLGYRSELETLAKISTHFHYHPIVSLVDEEPTPWTGETGFINNLWKARRLERDLGIRFTPENTHIFLCGNPLMIEAMLAVLGAEGFREDTKGAPGQLHLEKYW